MIDMGERKKSERRKERGNHLNGDGDLDNYFPTFTRRHHLAITGEMRLGKKERKRDRALLLIKLYEKIITIPFRIIMRNNEIQMV